MSVVAALLFFVAPAAADGPWPYPANQHVFPDAPPPEWAGYPFDDYNPSFYGGGRYREYYAFGRGYGVADFPPPLPAIPSPRPWRTYRMSAAAVPGGGAVPDQAGRAYIEVRVPADAEIWLEGTRTKQVGTARTFVSPPLPPGQNFGYDLRVRWHEKGRSIEEKRTITVRAGQYVVLQFPAPETLPRPEPVPPAERR